MHIGFLTSDLVHRHGWGHYSLSLIDALRRQGVQVTVAAAKNSPTNFDFPVYPSLPNVAPQERGQLRKMLMVAPQLRRVFADVDVLHITIESYAPLGLMLGKPYVITGHGSYAQAGVSRSRWVRPLHKRAFIGAQSVVCVSQYTAQAARAYTPAIQTDVVNNGVDPERFDDLPPLPNPPTRPTVLTAGGVKRRKGTLELVRAIANVRESVPDVQCVIIGSTTVEPDTTAAVQDLIATLKLQDHVFLLGFVDDATLRGWYGAADVFVLPSMNHNWQFEGYGLVHLEASAAGLPVIGTRECGASDAIIDGETGLLVSQSAIDEELPQAIVSILQNPQRAKSMGAAGYRFARQQTWDKAADEMLTLYRRV